MSELITVCMGEPWLMYVGKYWSISFYLKKNDTFDPIMCKGRNTHCLKLFKDNEG